MRKAAYRAFKCRLGVHRMIPWRFVKSQGVSIVVFTADRCRDCGHHHQHGPRHTPIA